MPKVIEKSVKDRAVRLVRQRRGEYPTLTKAVEGVARWEDVGKESLRRWVRQARIDGGDLAGMSSEELPEIKRLKAEDKCLREDVAILKAAFKISFARRSSTFSHFSRLISAASSAPTPGRRPVST